MRCRVIAHRRFANRGIDHSVDFLTNTNRLLGNHLMRAHALYRVVASRHISNDSIVIVGVEPSTITHLPTRFSIKRSVIKNGLAFFASLEFLHALSALNNGEDFAVIGARLSIPFKFRFRKLLVSRIRRLLGGAFPRGSGASSLLGHGTVETLLIKMNALIARCVLHEIKRHAE